MHVQSVSSVSYFTKQILAVSVFEYMFTIPYSVDVAFRAYQFKLEEVEGFRYRSRDAWRAVTRIAVREARLKEIRQEVLNCEKLKVCFFMDCVLSIT
jgi:hypothetical protein